MKRRSNSETASSSKIPRSTIWATSASSWSLTILSSVEFVAGQTFVGFAILCARGADDIGGQGRRGRLLVPADPFEIIADVLLIEGWLCFAGFVRIGRPEARRIWR